MKVFIDGMLESYRHLYSNLTNSKGEPTSVVYGFLNSILEYKRRFGVKPSVVWEGRNLERKEANQDYKANRESNKDMRVQVDALKEVFSLLNVFQYYADHMEADDVLYSFAEKYQAEGVVLVTRDSDLYQAMKENIVYFDPFKKIIVSRNDVFERMGVYPENIATLKAILGDNTDNITGVKRLPRALIKETIVTFGDVDKILNNIEQLPEKIRLKISENTELIRKNYALVKLSRLCDDRIKELPRHFDKAKLVEFLEKIEFKSFFDKLEILESFAMEEK